MWIITVNIFFYYLLLAFHVFNSVQLLPANVLTKELHNNSYRYLCYTISLYSTRNGVSLCFVNSIILSCIFVYCPSIAWAALNRYGIAKAGRMTVRSFTSNAFIENYRTIREVLLYVLSTTNSSQLSCTGLTVARFWFCVFDVRVLKY